MNQAPKHAKRLLQWYAGRADLEDLLGDLDEDFECNIEAFGKRRASLRYWRQTFSLLFSYSLKRRKAHAAYSPYYSLNTYAMFINYFKIAFRNFSKHKLFTSLNILGLSLGMSICLLALSIAVAVYQSDNWQEHKDRIYQVNTQLTSATDHKTYASTFPEAGVQLHKTYPFVENAVTIHSSYEPVFKHLGNEIKARGYFASSAFFDVFSFKLLAGDAKSALEKPFSIILTQKMAQKLFKDQDPVGKTLDTHAGTFTVTGVMEDLKQTHFYFEVLASYNTYEILNLHRPEKGWVEYKNHYTYVLLRDDASDSQLKTALSELSLKAESYRTDEKVQLQAVRLGKVVPRWNVSNAIGIGWDQPSLIFFISIGLLVLLPAVFNYTNLSIARALKRAKEIGIRKVIGADRRQIKAQFIVETIVLTFLALGGAVVLMVPLKNEFLSLIYHAQVLHTDFNGAQLLVFVAFSIAVGIVAGLFPAQYFAKLTPIKTIVGEIKDGKSAVSGLKKGLFVFQFFLSLVFIVGVLAFGRQYTYALNGNHGFQSDNILTVPFNGMKKELALTELEKHPEVKRVSAASTLPGVPVKEVAELTSNDLDTVQAKQVFVGDGFFDQMQMKLAWGNAAAMAESNQSEELVTVNRPLIEALKVFNNPGDTLRFTLADGTKCRVAAILEDLHFEPLSEQVDPLLIRQSLEQSQYAMLSIQSTDIKKTIEQIESVWLRLDQHASFESRFLDAEIEDSYYFLSVQIKFFSVLSVLAITISCLGLLGMVSYTTENRTKEIAVRKIMGANDRSLYLLLTKDFLKLIGVASLIAIPFSYFLYDRVVLRFLIQHGTGLGIFELLVSITFLFLVGTLSIYWQVGKVTKANPAMKLRYE